MSGFDNNAGTQCPPRVSVLITTYNAAEFIVETISSVLNQSFQDFELVVVDDGSTDDTFVILSRFTDSRVRLLRAPHNLGVVGARNFGYRLLRGSYVATLDHDDVWQPTRLEQGVAILDVEPTTVLVGTQCALLSADQVIEFERYKGMTSMLLRWLLLTTCPIIYSSLLFRREVAQLPDGGFMHPDVLYADDYELMLRLSSQGDCAVIDLPLTLYRMHGNNTTNLVRPEMAQNATKVLAKFYTRWFGSEAAAAAELMHRHIVQRQAATSLGQLEGLAVVLIGLRDGFLTTYQPKHEDRRRIVENAKDAYWRVVRASVRTGRVWLVGCYLRHPSLASVQPFPVDLAESLIIGLVRCAFHFGRKYRPPFAIGRD